VRANGRPVASIGFADVPDLAKEPIPCQGEGIVIRSLRVAPAVLRLRVLLPLLWPAFGFALTPDQVTFFESRIRPILAQDCYECHNSHGKAKGGLILDHREALLQGGDSGPAIVPGDADASLLIQAIRHDDPDLQMPKAGVLLDAPLIADFVTWVNQGAPDPRDAPPAESELAADTSWPSILARRKAWWSFQPIATPEVPPGDPARSPIDRFVDAKLAEQGLPPNPAADRLTLVRRLYFALTGLPPMPEEIDAFLTSGQPVAALVDELLARPAFGEKWARHWLDWIRYAESHGSEGDPKLVNAHYFRDYLIRALNTDVPYDQLVREQIAGDLLEKPRINRDLGLNESLIGTAHWRMVFHGFSPTDALDEKVRFTDDQINVFSQAYLGLTVSCARCHNHKFDAISQADYYALFGIFGSTRPGRAAADLPEVLHARDGELAVRKSEIRQALSRDWLAALPGLKRRLLADSGKDGNPGLLAEWRAVRGEGDLAAAWERRRAQWKSEQDPGTAVRRWELGQPAVAEQWFAYGSGWKGEPARPGEFAIAPEGEFAVTGIYPASVLSHAVTSKQGARFESPDVHLDEETDLWVLVRGDGGATARYVVHDYPRSGTIYPVTELKAGPWRWQKYELAYWKNDDVHLELTTAMDAPLLAKENSRSWFAVREARLVIKGQAAPVVRREFAGPLFDAVHEPATPETLADGFVSTVQGAINAWAAGSLSDAQALLLDDCVSDNLLPNKLDRLPSARPVILAYREIEAQVPVARRVPGLAEWRGRDQPLFVRGDHKKPSEIIPRRFLDAIDPSPYQTAESGRRQLAEDLLREDNPFTRRVIVNRIWHHLFDRGLVASPDNFGRLGEPPSHPELLDYLATHFVAEQGWSLKSLIRSIVRTEAWQRSTEPSALAREKDPQNLWLSHRNVHRLEAEAIRDSLLAVSGRLSSDRFVSPSGGSSSNRSIYVEVIRNRLDPFLATFDAPIPFGAKGRRDITNVPAQSLALMNDPFVLEAARRLAVRCGVEASETDRIRSMWRLALGRLPADPEIDEALKFLTQARIREQELAARRARIDGQIAGLEVADEGRLAPVRARLVEALRKGQAEPSRPNLHPVAEWTFDGDLRDSIGGLHGKAEGTARIVDGALVLDGEGFVATAPLDRSLASKTLEVIVRMTNFDQRSGGVMTVQDTSGGVFDSLVFAERRPGEWMAGSNSFARSDDFNGAPEAESGSVHLALVYAGDGTITAYRNGQSYGKGYRKANPVAFAAGQTQIVFGLRHGNRVHPGRMWQGQVLEARLYDRALTPEEVRETASGVPQVTRERILAALDPAAREACESARAEMERLRIERSSLGDTAGETQAWTDLAQSILNLKEFIHLR